MRPRMSRRLVAFAGVAALTLVACSGGSGTAQSSPSAPVGGKAPTSDGGTLNIGLVQEPTSFLAAGITDNLTFSYAVDALSSEGLLWYPSTDQTATARSPADFWRPALAI